MFGFLRRKPRFSPIAPLLAGEWDGTTLTLRVPFFAPAAGGVALVTCGSSRVVEEISCAR